MKRFLFLISAALIAIGAWSQASITLSPLPDDKVGKALTLTMNLCNTEDVKAIQCDLALPETVTFNDLYPTLANHANGFEVEYRLISDKQMRIVVSSGNMSLISPDSVAVVSFSVAVSATVAGDSITVSNAFVVLDDYRMITIPDSKFAAFTTKPSFIVSYMNDGVELYRDTVVQDDPIIPPSLPMDKEGYLFEGWNNLPEVMPGHDITVNAVYTKQEYNLAFVIDGDTLSTTVMTYNDTIVEPEVPAKEGYTFSGWTEYPETMPANDVTITGSFTVNKYKVTYIVDGETVHTDSVAYGTILTPIATPTKEGNTFSGWNGIPETMPAQDISITGSFVPNGYTLIYMIDGTEYKRFVYEYGTSITAEDEPAKEGHTFSGWSEIPETMPAQDITVTGEFSINKYLVTFTIDGEVLVADSLEYGASIIAPEAPDKEGHTFNGWGEVDESVPAYDLTYESNYTVNHYLLTYVVDGETMHTDSVAYGTTLKAIAEPTKKGYTFSGWSDIPTTMPANDVTIIGSFAVNSTQTDEQGLIFHLNETKDAYEVAGFTETLSEEIVIPSALYDLPVTSIQSKVFVDAEKMRSIVIPNSVTNVGTLAFIGCNNLLVVEWNAIAPVDADCFDEPDRHGNMLIFINNEAAKVTYEGNVITNGTAEEITLIAGLPFRNPREFTARNVSFTQEFTKKTYIGEAGGWEAMIVPFDVERVESATRGELKPFGQADFTTSLPYWVATLQADGSFVNLDSIKANTPFIMEVPNSDDYEDEYNIEGEVTFSATDATVFATTGNQPNGEGYHLIGSYEGEVSDSGIYALNEDEHLIDGATSLPGSVFVAGLRDIRPFEAYIYNAAPNRAPYLRIGRKGTTDIEQSLPMMHSNNNAWYTLQGVRLSDKPQERGIYIFNGKKTVIR